jgi:hypothetical protein
VTLHRAVIVFVPSSNLHYWCPAIWTAVVALLYPVFNALGVKVVPLITAKLSNHIIWFIVYKANNAVGFVLE